MVEVVVVPLGEKLPAGVRLPVSGLARAAHDDLAENGGADLCKLVA
jgi:hypothetical protein